MQQTAVTTAASATAGLSPADRKILLGAGIAFAILALFTVLLAPAAPGSSESTPSTYLSTPGGARAAFVLLSRLGIAVERWEQPPFNLAQNPSHTTLVLAEPTEPPSHAEKTALRHFVERGGRILFCGPRLPLFFDQAQLHLSRPKSPSNDSEFEQENRYLAVARSQTSPEIQLQPEALWRRFTSSQAPVYGPARNAVVVAWTLGQGEIIWWASATPLTNAGLTSAGNLPLFLNSLGVGSPRHVFWDEYYHGERGSLWDYIARSIIVRWGAVQLALLACLTVFAFSRRSGPVVSAAKLSRLSPLEFVETLGSLYRKAKASPLAVKVNLRQVRLALIRRLALPVTASNADLSLAAATRLGWNQSELNSVLVAAQNASAARALPAASALNIVQNLRRLAARLTDLKANKTP